MYNRPRTVLQRARAVMSGVNQGDDYTADEQEFMLAMDRFKRSARRPYPDCRDVLAVAKALGYRKV